MQTPHELMWAPDGRRLVVVSAHAARMYSAAGAPAGAVMLPARDSVNDAALSPDGANLALVVNRSQVVVAGQGRLRQLPGGAGVRDVSWSPDGRWLLVAWPAADQWVFVRAAGAPRVAAVSRIAQQLSAGASTGSVPAGSFPQLDGWCCTTRGPAG